MGERDSSSFHDDYQLSKDVECYLEELRTKRRTFRSIQANENLDVDTKRAALKVSSSVVSLVSFSGEEGLSQGCGTIIEADGENYTVLTSANLIRCHTEANVADNTPAANLKVIVHASDERSYIGKIYVYDFHYNVLVILFKSHSSFQAAKLRLIDIHHDAIEENSFCLRPHSVKVRHGVPVVVVGRYFCKPFKLQAAPGHFRALCLPSYDCKELLAATCSITMCGDGGPLINHSGEVIGIAFYHSLAYSPFLPINVVYRWWNHYKRYKELRHPSYNFEASNLSWADVPTRGRVMNKFPSIYSGVLVDKVLAGSQLFPGDIIFKCDGKTVESFLELWDLMWAKVGESVELEMACVCSGKFHKISIVVEETKCANKWPRWDNY